MTKKQRAALRQKMYKLARKEGATVKTAKRVAREPWRWLNEKGKPLAMHVAPRVGKPMWWND